MNLRQLRDLLALAEARKARDLARLERLQAERRAAEARIAAAVATPARDAAEGGLDAAPLALQGKRLIWAQAQIDDARRDQAALAPQIAAARAQATESLGKHSVLDNLVDRACRLDAARQDSRRERDAPGASAPGREPRPAPQTSSGHDRKPHG